MNGLDLFTGSGIGSLALKHTIPDYRTVCYVEIEPYCQAQIISRIADGILDDAPIWDDIKTFDGKAWHGKVDIISGGFPCQPFSVAGKHKGESDERNLWPETLRIISEVRPPYAFLENVPGLLAHEYIRTIFADLAEIGYDCEWETFGAGTIGCPYPKRRLWILCTNTGQVRLQRGWKKPIGAWSKQQFERLLRHQLQLAVPAGRLGRVAVRIPFRMDRTKALGNGWVPQVVRSILQVIENEYSK